jgi:hypothetical protein
LSLGAAAEESTCWLPITCGPVLLVHDAAKARRTAQDRWLACLGDHPRNRV